MLQDTTAEGILERLGDLRIYLDEGLAPYKEFKVGDGIYCFTPGDSSTARTRAPKR